MSRGLTSAGITLAAALGFGCHGDPDSMTGGLALEMAVRGEGNLAALYRVDEDGTIGFGGGEEARLGRVTWQGSITAQEIDRLEALLRRHGWYDGKPEATGEPRQRVYEIKFRWPGGSRQYRLRGESPDIAPVQTLLDQVCRRRFEPILETLPKADLPKRDAGTADTPDAGDDRPPDGRL